MTFAIDFDGTVVEHRFPEIGKEVEGAVQTMKQLQAAGHEIIIWTCRCEPYLGPMTAWLKERGFTPDAVNSNVAHSKAFGVPKVLADVYVDDKSFPPFTNWYELWCAFLGEDKPTVRL